MGLIYQLPRFSGIGIFSLSQLKQFFCVWKSRKTGCDPYLVEIKKPSFPHIFIYLKKILFYHLFDVSYLKCSSIFLLASWNNPHLSQLISIFTVFSYCKTLVSIQEKNHYKRLGIHLQSVYQGCTSEFTGFKKFSFLYNYNCPTFSFLAKVSVLFEDVGAHYHPVLGTVFPGRKQKDPHSPRPPPSPWENILIFLF